MFCATQFSTCHPTDTNRSSKPKFASIKMWIELKIEVHKMEKKPQETIDLRFWEVSFAYKTISNQINQRPIEQTFLRSEFSFKALRCIKLKDVLTKTTN